MEMVLGSNPSGRQTYGVTVLQLGLQSAGLKKNRTTRTNLLPTFSPWLVKTWLEKVVTAVDRHTPVCNGRPKLDSRSQELWRLNFLVNASLTSGPVRANAGRYSPAVQVW